MEDLFERFLQYIMQVNSGSEHTKAAYQRDIQEFIMYIREQAIDSFEDVDRIVVMNYIAFLRDKGGKGYSGMKNTTIARSYPPCVLFITI